MVYKYQHLALGGTFDLLHKGHQSLLIKAYSISRKLTIGITTNQFIKQADKQPHQTQTQRKKYLIDFLRRNKYLIRTKIIWINDIYGSTLKDKTIEGLVVSPETVKSAECINQQRTKHNLTKLKIIKTSWIKDDKGQIISSTRIRKGEINSQGQYYLDFLLKIANKQLNNKIRNQLKLPLGKIITNLKLELAENFDLNQVITVGDITTKKFLTLGKQPKLVIVDFLVERQPTFSNLRELGFNTINPDVVVKNLPGQISTTLIHKIHNCLNKPGSQIILVEGEEDLATIPAILLSPLGIKIFYGQPGKGLIMVIVDLEIKNKILRMFM